MRLTILLSTLIPCLAFVPSHLYSNIIKSDSFHGTSSLASVTGELETCEKDGTKTDNTSQDEVTSQQELSVNFRRGLDEFAVQKDLISSEDDADSLFPSSPAHTFSSPAEYDKSKFQLDDRVQFWIDYNRNGTMTEEDFQSTIAGVAGRFSAGGNDARQYWLRHLSRTGYFFANAALGSVASLVQQKLHSDGEGEDNFVKAMATSGVILRLLSEAALSYEQDYDNIKKGKYKAPHDMYTLNAQNNPLSFGRQTARFVAEAMGTMARRNRASEEDKRARIRDDGRYPAYYHTAFHYQTNGWMSRESANVYETSTETLFLGRQDAMQRTALVPLVEHARQQRGRPHGSGRKPLRVLEVACGTGRFMTFARDNLPPDSEFTAVDLSPFYLQKVKENDRNWRSLQRDRSIKPVQIVHAKGEDLPFAEEHFDAVVCMYLYHEIPREVRAQIAAEMARVTKKGGRVILTDSLQKGDRPVNDNTMGNFEKMNEPFYRDYIEDFLPRHFEDAGLECLTKTVLSSTKTLTFGKPL